MALLLSPAYGWLFFFNDAATTEIYTLSLHDALPIYRIGNNLPGRKDQRFCHRRLVRIGPLRLPVWERRRNPEQLPLSRFNRILEERAQPGVGRLQFPIMLKLIPPKELTRALAQNIQ